MFEWHYEEGGRVGETGVVLIDPFGPDEGSGYGEGSGTARGDRLSGSVVWSNRPRRRSDGCYLPDVRGVVITDDAARVLFDLRGRTVFTADGTVGAQSLVGWFESDSDRYRWLNDVVCVAEGTIRPATGQIEIHVSVVVNELADRH